MAELVTGPNVVVSPSHIVAPDDIVSPLALRTRQADDVDREHA